MCLRVCAAYTPRIRAVKSISHSDSNVCAFCCVEQTDRCEHGCTFVGAGITWRTAALLEPSCGTKETISPVSHLPMLPSL